MITSRGWRIKPEASGSSSIPRGRCPAHATESDGIAGQAGVGEAGVLAEPGGRAEGVGRRFPRAAPQDVFLALGGPARIRLRAGLVVARVVPVVAPLGHVAVHVE